MITTDAADLQVAMQHLFQTIEGQSNYDVNKDKSVDFADVQLIQSNLFGQLNLIDLTAPPQPATAQAPIGVAAPELDDPLRPAVVDVLLDELGEEGIRSLSSRSVL